MTEYFEGDRWIVEAHYGAIKDYKVETFTDVAEAFAKVKLHNDAGANVQVKRWHWVEVKADVSWHPTMKPRNPKFDPTCEHDWKTTDNWLIDRCTKCGEERA